MASRDQRSRRERAAAIQARQRRSERRRSLLIVGPAILVAVLIVGIAVLTVLNKQRAADRVANAAQRPIPGVKTFSGLRTSHVTTSVSYPQTPSVGGNHAGVWVNCGAYPTPIDAMQATHSLEHGAVWIGYRPGLAGSQVRALTRLTDTNAYLLVSPVAGMSSPVTASAWGRQLAVSNASAPRLATFVAKFQSGQQAPEPGGTCTGGSSGQ